ncbi:MAG: histidinol dehydrogenase [Firmicutes bacterium]|nr:histidinol dehydrogenase [Bacillota bacterium]
MRTIKEAAPRKTAIDKEIRRIVEAMIENVASRGDQALREYSALFDGSSRERFRVGKDEIDRAYDRVSREELADIRAAAANIRAFAEAQRQTIGELDGFSPQEGVRLGHRVIPVEAALCYVPGGNYPLYSTALMLIIPARVAGVKRICACSPTVKGTNEIDAKTLVAMDVAGADEIYALGGAQAIAAFSYGTEEIKAVDLIVGPGNQFVAEAKRQCYGQVGIDFIAGPSEVLVIADGSGDSRTVAADLLAQAEHAPNAKGILVSLDGKFARDVIRDVEAELADLPTADIAALSWRDQGEVLLAADAAEAIAYANSYAPEHLELNVAEPGIYQEHLHNYGSLFVGQNTAEVFGDYASGTNHTLPTVRAARYTGGLYVGTFLKTCTWQEMTPAGAAGLAPLVARLAYGEGLAAHARAAEARLGDITTGTDE